MMQQTLMLDERALDKMLAAVVSLSSQHRELAQRQLDASTPRLRREYKRRAAEKLVELVSCARVVDAYRTVCTDRLSRCASAIERIFASASDACDEIAMMHAPSECYGDVSKSARRDIQRALHRYGYDAQSFLDELRARTSDRFVYSTSFDSLLDD